jgi:hypothetical protein
VSRDDILDREATVNGIRAHYNIAGSGSPLLLLHGSPLTSRSWLGIMPALAKTHTVAAPDFRGHGQSEKPTRRYEVQTMVEDLRQLLDQLGMKSLDIVGPRPRRNSRLCLCRQAWRPGFATRNHRGSDGRGSPTIQGVLASYWRIGLYAHPRMPELLITGRERDYLAEFIRTYQYKSGGFSEEDLDTYAHPRIPRWFAARIGRLPGDGCRSLHGGLSEHLSMRRQPFFIAWRIRTADIAGYV